MRTLPKLTGTVAPVVPAADETLTLEQRVEKLEQAFAKFALAGHNAQYAALGSPPNKAGAAVFKNAPPLAKLIERESERVVAEDQVEYCDDMRRLERELAYSAACSDIECHCMPVGEMGPGVRWSLVDLDPSAISAMGEKQVIAVVNRAADYLEWRGCFEIDPDIPSYVRILEAS